METKQGAKPSSKGNRQATKIYEHLGSTTVAADGIRPGGRVLTSRALAFCDFAKGSSVLDIGCGSGITVEYLREENALEPVGLDSSAELLARARQRTKAARLVMGSGFSLPFGAGSFHGVFLECVFSLLEDQRTALRECHRVLQVGGRIIVSDVYARDPYGIPRLRSLNTDCCLRGAMDRDHMLENLRTAGFSILLWEDHSYLLKEFAADLVWFYGSLEKFWNAVGQPSVDRDAVAEAVRQARPGYCLIVGRKETSLTAAADQ
jgi:arsenite methyltransferase